MADALRWPPVAPSGPQLLGFTLLYDLFFPNVGGTGDLLPTNRTWQRGWDVTSALTIHKIQVPSG